MVLLYVFGGIGVGMFFMLRRRRSALATSRLCGASRVAFMQALAAINEWPLLWMSYDTAVPRTTFFAQQCATIGVTFLGFSVFFALSFMAAETLTRAAFGDHPQFWRVWSRGSGSSTAILGRTAGGYLLVSLFFAYDVRALFVHDAVFGWWSPAEALLHPDVLATYAPWLSAIANSFQAGFWEECLFRAVHARGRRPHRRSVRRSDALPRDRVHRAGGRVRCGPRALSESAFVRPAGRAHHPLRLASASSTPISDRSGHRPPLHLRRRLVRPSRCSSLLRLASGSSNS